MMPVSGILGADADAAARITRSSVLSQLSIRHEQVAGT
jgi:hypothetical protein